MSYWRLNAYVPDHYSSAVPLQGVADIISLLTYNFFIVLRISRLCDDFFWNNRYLIPGISLVVTYFTLYLRCIGIALISVQRYITVCLYGTRIEKVSGFRWVIFDTVVFQKFLSAWFIALGCRRGVRWVQHSSRGSCDVIFDTYWSWANCRRSRATHNWYVPKMKLPGGEGIAMLMTWCTSQRLYRQPYCQIAESRIS